MSIISYLRVSTAGQTVENQRQAIAAAGYEVEREFADQATSGTTAADSRSGWAACAQYLRDGDTPVVYALDRLGRSTVDVLTTINTLGARGVRLVILQQQFDIHACYGCRRRVQSAREQSLGSDACKLHTLTGEYLPYAAISIAGQWDAFGNGTRPV
jgi:hypothetical protein